MVCKMENTGRIVNVDREGGREGGRPMCGSKELYDVQIDLPQSIEASRRKGWKKKRNAEETREG